MASHRENVIVAGQLEGMGRREECQVHAVKVSLPGTPEYEYARPTIFDAPSDLQDGVYTLSFDRRSVKVQRVQGAWVAPSGDFLKF